MLSVNAGYNNGTPRFRLYKNGTIIKEYNNNSANGNIVNTSMEIELNEGDTLYGQQYGGDNRGTYFITTFYKLSN